MILMSLPFTRARASDAEVDQLWSVDSSACSKYIFQIYILPPSLGPPPQGARAFTLAHTLIDEHTRPPAHPSKRSIVRTFAPSVIADSHPRPPSPHLAPGLRRRSRGCTYVSCIRLSSAIYSRATRAAQAGAADYIRGKERAPALPIKGIMNRGATSFFSSLLPNVRPV